MRREGRGEEEETLRGLETRFGEERFAKDTVRIGLEEKPCPEILSGFTRFYGHPLYLLHRVTEWRAASLLRLTISLDSGEDRDEYFGYFVQFFWNGNNRRWKIFAKVWKDLLHRSTPFTVVIFFESSWQLDRTIGAISTTRFRFWTGLYVQIHPLQYFLSGNILTRAMSCPGIISVRRTVPVLDSRGITKNIN